MLFLSFFIASQVHAKEISKGTVELSGASTFFISSSETTVSGMSGSVDEDTLLLSLSAIYYVAPNVGVGVFWAMQNSEYDDGTNSAAYNNNTIGPIVAYNVSIDPSSGFGFFAGFILIGDYERETNGFTTSEGDLSGHVLGVDFKHFVTESVSVNVGIELYSIEEEEDGGSSVETDSTDIGIGLSVYF